jgi:hypothetical protein
MIEKGVDASCSEDEASDFEEIEAEGDNDKSIPGTIKDKVYYSQVFIFN